MVATPAMLPRNNPPKRAAGDSYEEFHPYGTTAWSAEGIATVSLKRYKFTGMERDDETGLQCHGVRYYATWLGRWTSADPIGLGDGGNRYCYCHVDPIGGSDRTGLFDPTGMLRDAHEAAKWVALAGGVTSAVVVANDAAGFVVDDPLLAASVPVTAVAIGVLIGTGLALGQSSAPEAKERTNPPPPQPKPQPKAAPNTTTTTTATAKPKEDGRRRERSGCEFREVPHAGGSKEHDRIAQKYQAPERTGDVEVTATLPANVRVTVSFDAEAADGELTEVKTLRYGAYSPRVKDFALFNTLRQVTEQAVVASVCGRDYKVVATSEWLSMDIVENTFGAVRVERDDRTDYRYHDFTETEDDLAFIEDIPELVAR